MVWIKAGIVLTLVAIIFSLGSGLFYLMADKGQSTRTVKALSWRIGLSLALFALIVLGMATGVITPNASPLAH